MNKVNWQLCVPGGPECPVCLSRDGCEVTCGPRGEGVVGIVCRNDADAQRGTFLDDLLGLGAKLKGYTRIARPIDAIGVYKATGGDA